MRGDTQPVSRRAFWALADQGAVSAGNFLTGWYLARTLPPSEFGIYVVIIGVMIFANTIHAALVTSPLCVKGAAAGAPLSKRYTGWSLALTTGFLPVQAIAIAAICFGLGRLALAPWAVMALLLWQLQETVRSGLVSQCRFRSAIVGDFVSYIGQALAVVALTRHSANPLLAVFAIMTATSVLGAVIQSAQLELVASDLFPIEGYLASAWNMGRWWFFGRLAGVFTVQAFPWVLAFWQGVASAGTYQALITVLAVTNPVLFSLNNLVLASVSRSRGAGGPEAVRQTALRCAAQSCMLLLPYFAVVLLLPGLLITLFYGRSSVYMQVDGLLRILVVAYFMETIACVSSATLGGLERTAYVFTSQFISAAVAIAGCLPAALLWGVPAAVGGLAVVNTVKAATSTYFVLKLTWRRTDTQTGLLAALTLPVD